MRSGSQSRSHRASDKSATLTPLDRSVTPRRRQNSSGSLVSVASRSEMRGSSIPRTASISRANSLSRTGTPVSVSRVQHHTSGAAQAVVSSVAKRESAVRTVVGGGGIQPRSGSFHRSGSLQRSSTSPLRPEESPGRSLPRIPVQDYNPHAYKDSRSGNSSHHHRQQSSFTKTPSRQASPATIRGKKRRRPWPFCCCNQRSDKREIVAARRDFEREGLLIRPKRGLSRSGSMTPSDYGTSSRI